jgi:thiol-disulfide isomerase/thioredoxin
MNTSARVVSIALAVLAAGALGYGAYNWMHDRSVPTPVAAPSSPPPATEQETKVPEMRPLFSLKDQNDRLRSISEWDGKSLVINFWATWCAPCRREIPMLRQLHAKRAAQNIEVIGIAVDFRDNVLAYIKEVQIDYPLLIGEQDGLDAASAFGLGSMGFPFTVFTDNAGHIVAAHLGELHPDQADLILDTVVAVNQGTLTLEQARTRIADGLKALETHPS